MSELLWSCGNGTEFVATKSTYRVMVRRSSSEAGYEFQIATSREQGRSIATGFRNDLRETVDLAEQTLQGLLGDDAGKIATSP